MVIRNGAKYLTIDAKDLKRYEALGFKEVEEQKAGDKKEDKKAGDKKE